MKNDNVFVDCEVGRLRKIMVHSPDDGLGKIIPAKAQDWLFEDILHLETLRKDEYDLYTKLLLYFLDPEKAKQVEGVDKNDRSCFNPEHPNYFNSDKVLEPQFLLSQILEDDSVKKKLVASVVAHERISYKMQEQLLELKPVQLAAVLVSGIMPDQRMIFPPVPNFIFTRDIAVVVNDHVLLTKPATTARSREGILSTYIFFNHVAFKEMRDRVIEVSNSEDYFLFDAEERKLKTVSVEGGDVMMVAPNHLLIGCSERTTLHGTSVVIQELFARNVVDKVSVIKIPNTRAFMHIDTTFTQVKRNMWVLFAPFSKSGTAYGKQHLIPELGEPVEPFSLEIIQVSKDNPHTPKKFFHLEDLLDDVSQNDLGSTEKTEFILSGDGEFPFVQREQWTDSCNVLALKEGVVIGYDRNNRTADAFRKKGFDVIHVNDLLKEFEEGVRKPDDVENTLILLTSGELSRARGGSHCISMPLLRDSFF
ncbi:arginine deiminase family protein [Flammeovirgaceae bacterium SG7u.111]|nr:arginine deiminase family protein [Flammeovirgaceae bacterium SG7u.132]WPO33092.1 arginine deiminase family protein [Flammeovirgaceae bacterium SG7u.111]